MSSDLLQQVIVLAIIGGALAFLALKVVRAIRAARGKRAAACASGCGCAPDGAQPPHP